jgi:flagellar hook-associated protein FlgK
MGFGGLGISVSGLLASQSGLEVTSNNIANANTEGYSRRMIHFTEGPTAQTKINSRLLSGVQISDINRVRHSLLDNQVRQQNGNFHFDNMVAEISVAMNDILGEPSDSGLSAKLNQFFQAASDFAANPEVATAKTVFINAGDSLAKAFNQIDQSFEIFKGNISDSSNGMIVSTVDELNNKLAELLDVHQISLLGNNSGTRPEDLNDKRDDGAGDLRRLTLDINATEARAIGTANFSNIDSPIAALTAGNNSIDLSINNGNGTVTGPFTVNFDPNSTPRDVVAKINNTFKAAGGEGEIASLDSTGRLNLSTSLVADSVNNVTAEVNVVGGLGTTLATLGLAVGPVNGSDATTEVLLDSQGLYYNLDVESGAFDVGSNPNRIQLRTNDPLKTLVGTLDKGFGGSLGGLVHMSNEVVPKFQNDLSDFAMSMMDSVNKILQLGTTASGTQGAPLFIGTDAGNLSIDKNIASNPSMLSQGKTGAASDGSIMSEIAELFFGTNNIVGDLSINEEMYIDSPGGGPVTPVQSVIALIPGQAITIHADGIIMDGASPVNAGQNGFGGGSLVQIQFRDANGALIGGPVDFPASAGAPESRVTYTGTVPAGAASVEVVMNGAFNDGNLLNNQGHFGIQVLQGTDGSTASSFNNKMADIVGAFGTQGSLAISNSENSGSLLQSLTDRRQSIMGVSVEEEAAELIKMQNAFGANARVVNIWDEIYQTIINMI